MNITNKLLNFIAVKLESISYRLHLINECSRLKSAGKFLPDNYKKLIIKAPVRYDDFINFICFLDNNLPINLIDIGANVGDFTKDFLMFFPRAKKVICFEPICKLIPEIQKNVQDKRVSIINAGLSSKAKKITINYPENNTTLASFHTYNKNVNEFYKVAKTISEKVKVLKLDEICSDFSKTQPFIIKIDTQGHEIDVIKGGLKVISKASILILECSFVSEYEEKAPSFLMASKLLESINFYPIIFQKYNRKISSYAFERDVIFVKKDYLPNIFYKNY